MRRRLSRCEQPPCTMTSSPRFSTTLRCRTSTNWALPKRKDVALRLYSIGHSGTCVEETEWVCSCRYVLAVSEFGETRTRAVYDLGEVGQLGAIQWLPRTTPDHAALELEVRNYTDHAKIGRAHV